jgi:tricorn protease
MLAATVATLLLAGQAQEMRLMRFPDVHENKIVFTYGSDLWLADRGGGYARRLTTHPGVEFRAKFSPDGKWIAFTGAYDGSNEVYVIPSEGGEPKRLTFMPGNEYALSWTPDGKIALASGYGNPIPFTAMLYKLSPQGGTPEPTKLYEVHQGTFSPDGQSFAYNRRGSYNYNWRRYRGGVQGEVSIYNFATNDYRELPSGRENSWFPMWIGDSIYYISDRNQGTVNLYRHDLKNKRDVQLTRYADGDIKWPSTDGKSIVWERDGYLVIYDIAGGKEQNFAPLVRSDMVAARPQLRKLGNEISAIDLSPSASRVVAEARGEIFSIPVKAGETRNLTQSPGSRERLPAWSPDGQTIAFFSDESGDNQIYTVPQMGGKPTKITDGKALNPLSLTWSNDGKMLAFTTRDFSLYLVDVAAKKLTRVVENRYSGIVQYDFSPDSKWLAYVDAATNMNAKIMLYEIASGKAHQVTDGYYFDSGVAFDTTGKYLFFTSNRTFTPSFGLYEFSLKVEDATRIYVLPLDKELTNPLIPPADEEPEPKPNPPAGGQPQQPQGPPSPKPMKVDLEGLADRAIALPLPAGRYGLVTGVTEGILYATPGALARYDLKSRENQTLLAMPGGMQSIAFNPSRTKMAYLTGQGVFVVDVRPGLQPGQGGVSTSAVEAIIDPRQEWKQMFWEVWRYERDFFYDPAMVGVDWNTVARKYEKFLPHVSDRSDMGYILGLMIGELGTGHAYVQGFGSPTPYPVNQGLLGADYEVSGGNVRFKKIYRGANFDESRRGPLGEPGVNVKEGEYLLEIDGRKVDADTHPNQLLQGKAGRTVVLTVNSAPSTVGARQVRVLTTGSEDQLRYYEWVEDNRRKVDQMSGGRIGYMHIPNTSFQGAVELIRGFYSQWNKDAVLIDERFNGGGYVQPWFVDTLVRRIRAAMRSRYGQDVPDARGIDGPKALLINEYAGSGGDLFPWMFRQAEAGPLIGMRTWGGLVGIRGGVPLLDGGSVTAPEFGLYDRETGKWIAENTGVDPDIEVDNRPDLLAQGRDPQLEKGVEYLMNELKKQPRQFRRPDFPRTVPPPGGGK